MALIRRTTHTQYLARDKWRSPPRATKGWPHEANGGAAGDEIANDYSAVLAAIGVVTPAGGFPYVDVTAATTAQMGPQDFSLGVCVNKAMLEDLNAYLFGLQAPAGVKTDTAGIAHGLH